MASQDDIEIPKTSVFGGTRPSPLLARDPSVFDAVAGIVVVSLSILGLADIGPRTMAALACIGVGAAVVFEGLGVVRRYRRVAASHGKPENAEIRGAMLAQVAGGGVGLVLGLLALVGVEPLAFSAIASIVFGASLILGTGAEIEVDSATAFGGQTGRVIRDAVIAASGARLLVAVASVTLGVLAVFGVETLTLLLAASLLLGVGLLLGSVSSADRSVHGGYSGSSTA